MENKLIHIDKGINLLHIKSDKFKTVNVAVLIRRGLDREEATKNALIPQVLKRGSKNYNTLSAINIKAEELYGAVFDSSIMKKGEEQIIQFYLEVLNETVDKNLLVDGLEFMKDIILNPIIEDSGFKKEYVEGEKENLRRKIESRVNDKKEYAKLKLLENMCRDEPFGIYGDGYIEDLDRIDSENLYGHYKKVLAESPIYFVVIGAGDTEDIAKKIKEIFHIDRGEVKEIDKPQIIYNPKKDVARVTEKAEIAQAKLCVGMRSDFDPSHKSFYELLVMNEVFGGSPESKLFINVREKESLCYYVSSFIYRFKTILLIQSGVDEKEADKAIELIKKQVDDMKNGDISDDEIEKAKNSLVKKYKGVYDYPQSVMDFYLAEQMLGLENGLDDAIKNVEGVDKESVIEAAARVYFDTEYLLSATGRN